MKVGILGLPETGKTTLYNALTRSSADVGHFHGTETHVAVTPVPDPRFDHAVDVCKPKKVHPATIEFTDDGARIERVERGAQREKFGTDFFAGVRNMDALVLVVRGFRDASVPEPAEGIDPRRDTERILEELLLADLAIVESRIEKLEKARLQKRQSPAEAAEHQVLARIETHLNSLQPVRTLQLTDDERRALRSYAFVSGKPLILIGNVGEGEVGNEAPASVSGLTALAAEQAIPLITLCAKVEMDIAQMDPDEEREFLEAMGIAEAARDRLIRAAYAALGLISFFTVGEDEVRAWTIGRGTSALGAAEKIHSDIARGFIRAEVMSFDDFRSGGGCWDDAKAAGKMRLEGKEYVVKDGDIVHVRFKI